jgi:hypothetical protein
MACGYMQTGAMSTLLEAGADPLVKDKQGRDVVTLVENLRRSMPPSMGALQRIMALEQVAGGLTDRCGLVRLREGQQGVGRGSTGFLQRQQTVAAAVPEQLLEVGLAVAHGRDDSKLRMSFGVQHTCCAWGLPVHITAPSTCLSGCLQLTASCCLCAPACWSLRLLLQAVRGGGAGAHP